MNSSACITFLAKVAAYVGIMWGRCMWATLISLQSSGIYLFLDINSVLDVWLQLYTYVYILSQLLSSVIICKYMFTYIYNCKHMFTPADN